VGTLGGSVPIVAVSGRSSVSFVASGTGATLATLTAAKADDGFGSFIKLVGDVDGDGVGDVAIGSSHAGVVEIFSGSALRAGVGDRLVSIAIDDCVISVDVVVDAVVRIDVVTYTVSGGEAPVITRTTFDAAGKQVSFVATGGLHPKGDVDLDFKVDADDVDLVLSAMGKAAVGGSPFSGDVDGNGFVDEQDLAFVISAASSGESMDGDAALLNQYLAMTTGRVAFFDYESYSGMSSDERAVQAAQTKCQDCPPGQARDCRNICCGPGSWQDKENNSTKNVNGNSTGYFKITNGFGWEVGHGSGYHNGSANPAAGSGSASVHGDGVCAWSIFSHSFSSSATSSASWNYSRTNRWVGTGPVCARAVSLAASGGGSEAVAVTCGANSSCTAAASASGSASCSSLGNASATMNMHSLSLDAAYNSGTSKVDISGNAGAQVTDNQATVTGSYSGHSSWSIAGTGSKAGTASYSVAQGRTYNNNCTATAYTISHAGSVAASGSGTWGSPGSVSWSASSQAMLRVN
ncbi:MAG TPA: hypothetical protein PKU91_06410, partial [Phycisphaerales bacterium]|nr:hypothetical protein [Phycisphaerales bacterium]